jgi:hypothetical protein
MTGLLVTDVAADVRRRKETRVRLKNPPPYLGGYSFNGLLSAPHTIALR